MLSHFSHVRFFATLWTTACQAPLSMGFSRQEYWSGLPCPTPGNLPDPRIEPSLLCLLHWQVGSLILAPSWVSVQFSHSVVSDSLWPHELEHARPPCPSQTPGVHPNSCPLSRWCHPAISPSVIPFSSCPQSLQHQSLFQWVNSSHEVAKVLEFQL